MAAALYRKHDPASQTKYQEVKQLARSQQRVLSGSPGTLKQRTQAGKQYWVREYIRVDGKKTDEYIGAVAATPKEVAERIAKEVELAKGLATASGHLRLLGYQRIDRKPAAVLEVLFNKGLFSAGLTLVGSHAYGVLLNELGIIAPGYRTQDIDLARGHPLAIALPTDSSLHSMLKETGLNFVPIPGMPSHRPSSSFKLPGAESLAVDLLVPGRTLGKVVAVEELGAYAQAIPLLDFLIEDAYESVVLSPNQIIPLRVPSPERFFLHKVFSSQSRTSSNRDKVQKDLQQAAVLAAAIEDEMPGRIRDAFKSMPATGKPAVRRGLASVLKLLGLRYMEATEALSGLVKR